MLSQRQTLLEAIIADPHSTDLERETARKEINEGRQVDQTLQDRELEAYLQLREIPHESFRARDMIGQMSPASTQLLRDICDPQTLAIIPERSESRLQALLERTGTEIVREHALASLASITWLESRGKHV